MLGRARNAFTTAEWKDLLLRSASRRQLFDLSDDMATKVDTQFYQDGRDALLKALVE